MIFDKGSNDSSNDLSLDMIPLRGPWCAESTATSGFCDMGMYMGSTEWKGDRRARHPDKSGTRHRANASSLSVENVLRWPRWRT
jgi:hypothetical protein